MKCSITSVAERRLGTIICSEYGENGEIPNKDQQIIEIIFDLGTFTFEEVPRPMKAPQRRWLPLALAAGLLAPLFTEIAPAIALPPPLKAQIITASSPAASAKFGGSMSMSSDGATMIVGSPGSAGGGDAAIYDCTDGAGCTKNTDLAALATRTVNVTSYVASLSKVTIDRKSTRLNSSHMSESRMPSSA